jgi:hypothetical protein
MDQTKRTGNTLLAQLGFADPDRGNPRHDLAVAFACLNATELVRVMGLHSEPDATDRANHNLWSWSLYQEQAVMRPDLRYACQPSPFFVGFADAFWFGDGCVVVEVKITKEPASNVMRQIAAYRSGFAQGQSLQNARGLLLVDYDMSSVEVDMLKGVNVTSVRLGARFDAFVAAQSKVTLPTF